MLLAKKLSADEAFAVGLLTEVYQPDELDERVLERVMTSEDLREGVTALFQKRPPAFKGK